MQCRTPQGIYSKKPLASAADLKGSKWRAYSPATARIAELVGAQPVTVQAAELSQALATGVVESYMSSGSTGLTARPMNTSRTGTTSGLVAEERRTDQQEGFDALDKATQTPC